MYYKKGEMVGDGTYWGVSTGTRTDVEKLEKYLLLENSIRAHIFLVLAFAPIIGLLFAVFLPAVAIVMTLNIIVKKIAKYSATMAYFAWRPLESYLSGKKKK
jgi:hydrogenase-4 membrane subunit HyfE